MFVNLLRITWQYLSVKESVLFQGSDILGIVVVAMPKIDDRDKHRNSVCLQNYSSRIKKKNEVSALSHIWADW